jgi:hypothetical protein
MAGAVGLWVLNESGPVLQRGGGEGELDGI